MFFVNIKYTIKMLKQRLLSVYHKFIPIYLRRKLLHYRVLCNRRKIIATIKKQYSNHSEITDIIKFVQNNTDIFIPYESKLNINPRDIQVFTEKGAKYVLHENKRLYFPQNYNKQDIQQYYYNLLREQEINSPHRYEIENVTVQNGDIVADAGAAEGFFALSVIDKVKKIYLFEGDKNWLEALNKTFAPYADKVEIVAKYLSEKTDENNTTIDDFFDNKHLDFIKADIEGSETTLLKYAKNTLVNKQIKLVVCTYHRDTDADDIQKILLDYGYQIEFSNGWLICPFIGGENILRKGVIRAYKL